MKKLSIITICFNEEKRIKNSIESVINQSYKDIEYIIIDGKSTDNTVNIINQYKDKVSYFISEKDNGIYNAMNKGIKVSNGEYLLFLNAGDILYDNNTIEKLFSYNFNEDIIYCDIWARSDTGREHPVDFKNDRITPLWFYTRCFAHQGTIIKKELFIKYGFYDESFKICGDYDFFVRSVVKNKASYKYIPITLTIYNLDGISGNKNSLPQIEKEKKIIKKRYFNLFLRFFINLSLNLNIINKNLKNLLNKIKKIIKVSVNLIMVLILYIFSIILKLFFRYKNNNFLILYNKDFYVKYENKINLYLNEQKIFNFNFINKINNLNQINNIFDKIKLTFEIIKIIKNEKINNLVIFDYDLYNYYLLLLFSFKIKYVMKEENLNKDSIVYWIKKVFLNKNKSVDILT